MANKEDYSARVLDSLADAVFTIDLGGRVLYANKALALLLEYPHEQLLGRAIETLLSLEREVWRARSGFRYKPYKVVVNSGGFIR